MASWVGSMFTLPAPLAWYPSGPSFHFMSMIQPLSGDNSVLGICLISGGDSVSMLTTSSYVSSREIGRQNGNPVSDPEEPEAIPGIASDLDQVFPVVGAEAES